jgi:DNA gyrase/topoisomerase IV subunit B
VHHNAARARRAGHDAQGAGTHRPHRYVRALPAGPADLLDTEFEYETVSKRLRETAYLMGSRGMQNTLRDERTGSEEV